MAYDPNNLSAMCYANGATWWDYRTTMLDSAFWREEGYFDAANSLLRPGDFMVIRVMDYDTTRESIEVCFGGLCIVHRVRPHVVLSRVVS